jgi:esterase/lipase superfamily enzyme
VVADRLDGRAGPRAMLVALALALGLALGCSGPPLSLDLMPAPGVYAETGLDPFADDAPIESLPDFSLLYATLRRPATEDDRERFYTNDRGVALRGGVARVEVGRADFTWDEARRVSLAKNRPDRYPLEVTAVRDLGILESSIFTPRKMVEAEGGADERFAALVNERLARSRVKDVYIYVHGYKVVFENPLLVASELWHFLGYEGAMIAFSWPSTPSRWAYFSDVETAAWSAQGFRRLLLLLAEKTDARRIHVLGYSAGTRVVTLGLDQLALIHYGDSREAISESLRLGDVVLVGSDVDRGLMGVYIEDGLLKTQDRLTLYLSGTDQALGFANRIFGGRVRAGEAFSGPLSDEVKALLEESDALSVIDVTDAEESDVGNGHAYFRRSPWASSDILMTLATDLGPAERGLVRGDDSPIWQFPPDYIERLTRVLEDVVPGFAAEAP